MLAALWAASFFVSAQAAPKPAPPQQVKIDKNGIWILTRSILVAVDQANKTGNYTVLRDLSAPGFASVQTAAKLAEIFAGLRRDKIDLSGVLVIEPQLNGMPQINAQGMLQYSGFFPSAPSQINFDLMFAPVEGQWKLYGVSVNIGSATPVAPPAPMEAPVPAPKIR